MHAKFLGAAAALTLALAGCVTPPPSAPAGPAEDMSGAARSCTASPVTLADAKETAATMTMGNDGGWCALRVSRPSGGAFASQLLTTQPANGHIFMHRVNNFTRVEYTPNPGFRGTDSFVARFIPGDAAVRVAVTVQ